MKKPSKTAQLAAAHRAYHFQHVKPVVLEDTEASWLVGPPLNFILSVGLLRRLVFERLLERVRPVSTFVVVRSRYTEDCFEQLIGEGYHQYVMLGAGLDSWALRNEVPGVSVFELDHPATQQWKESRIIARMGAIPSHLSFIPIDFESESIGDALSDPCFDAASRTFVSWLGTIYYLTPRTIETTFTSLANACSPGSRIVFDYFEPKNTMSPADLRLFEDVDQGGTRRGEPLQTLMTSGEMAKLLHSTGFSVVEDLSASEITDRYLSGRSDGLDLPGFARLCCAEVTAPADVE